MSALKQFAISASMWGIGVALGCVLWSVAVGPLDTRPTTWVVVGGILLGMIVRFLIDLMKKDEAHG